MCGIVGDLDDDAALEVGDVDPARVDARRARLPVRVLVDRDDVGRGEGGPDGGELLRRVALCGMREGGRGREEREEREGGGGGGGDGVSSTRSRGPWLDGERLDGRSAAGRSTTCGSGSQLSPCSSATSCKPVAPGSAAVACWGRSVAGSGESSAQPAPAVVLLWGDSTRGWSGSSKLDCVRSRLGRWWPWWARVGDDERRCSAGLE